jgi:hypothetical protein
MTERYKRRLKGENDPCHEIAQCVLHCLHFLRLYCYITIWFSSVDGKVLVTAEGETKKDAQDNAALEYMRHLGIEFNSV